METIQARSIPRQNMDTDDEEHRHPWNPVEAVSHWWKNHFADDHYSSRSEFASTNPLRETHITLHFDADKNKTVAVLSCPPTEALSVYFTCRVAQGTAVQRSILYYELDGYVRNNFTRLRMQHVIAPNSTTIAMGSLEASDQSHQNELENYKRQQDARHRDSHHFNLLPEVMEIVCNHWLNDDLDALTIFFLSQVSRDMNSIARRIATHRLKDLRLAVTPYVDGASVSGVSTFQRADNSPLVQHKESGRSVEYRQCETIPLMYDDNGPFATFVPANEADHRFDWECEELALGNLRWWFGGIEEVEYVGQKLVVSCKLNPADSEKHCNEPIALSSVRLEVNPRPGKREWPHGFVNLSLEIIKSDMRQLDQVAMSYSGGGRVRSVSVHFFSLVRLVARRRLNELRVEMDKIRQDRPLLHHEHIYLRCVQKAATSL